MQSKGWIVTKYPYKDGIIISMKNLDAFIILNNPDEEHLYGPCSYFEAEDYFNDVKDIIIKPIHIKSDRGE